MQIYSQMTFTNGRAYLRKPIQPTNDSQLCFFVVAGLTYTICSYLAYIQNCNHHHNNNTTQTKWMRFGVKTTKLGGRIICVWVSLAFAKLYTHFELINTHRLGSHMILYIYDYNVERRRIQFHLHHFFNHSKWVLIYSSWQFCVYSWSLNHLKLFVYGQM